MYFSNEEPVKLVRLFQENPKNNVNWKSLDESVEVKMKQDVQTFEGIGRITYISDQGNALGNVKFN